MKFKQFMLFPFKQLLDFKSSCVIKNRRKASNIKVLKFINQKSPQYWVGLRQDALQRTNPQKHFHRTFIKSVHVGRLFIGRRNRPTLLQSIFSSFVSLGSCKTTLKTHTPSSCLGPSSPSDLWTCYVCVSTHPHSKQAPQYCQLLSLVISVQHIPL